MHVFIVAITCTILPVPAGNIGKEQTLVNMFQTVKIETRLSNLGGTT